MIGLIPWRRSNDLVDSPLRFLHREMDPLFRSFFGDADGAFGPGFPPVDLVENPESFVLRAELPGSDGKDVEVRMTGDLLTVSGEKKHEEVREGSNLHFRECRYGRWSRSFRLPSSADAERIEARMVNGVLEISVGKRAEARPRVVEVKTA